MKINKRKWILLVLLLCLISGCGSSGGGGNQYGNVSGTVVDSDGHGVVGALVTIDTVTATTDASGQYTFTGIPTGTRVISVSGGSSGDELGHLAGGTAITVHSGDNAIAPLQVYNMIGFGVVIRSASADKSLAPSIINKRIQAILAAGAVYQPGFGAAYRNMNYNVKAATSDFLIHNQTSCYLHWRQLPGITHYIIYYLDGLAETLVWDSSKVDTSIEPYSSTDPKAYLDLGSELAGIINSPGVYLFRIEGVPTTGANQKLPAIAVSVGRRLGECPELHSPESSQLSWKGVVGANGYIVGLFSGDTWTNNIYLSPILQTDLFFNISTIITLATPKKPYSWYVKAHALDDAGWTEEVTVDMGLFDY